MSRTLLIDADILVYQLASTNEDTYEFCGQVAKSVDLERAQDEVYKYVERILKKTDSDQPAFFLTGSNNFRKKVYPLYKANRLGVEKPALLYPLREFIQEEFKLVFLEDKLEGDDLIGIHATKPHKGERVIFSADKDLKTIPGLHWDPDDGEIVEITEKEADRFFYEQVLTGDPTDNYPGCPGVGPKMASRLLDKYLRYTKNRRILKSGPNKGQERIEWKLEQWDQWDNEWSSITSAYLKAGLTEKQAITQARCARILRHGEYDFEKGEVNLWTPNKVS